MTADTSGIADDDGLSGATFSYQWVSNDGTADRDIAGATDSTYTLVAADEGKTIRVRVSFTDDAANEESLTSDATAVVAARPNSPATGGPAITGTAQVGETLTADTSGIADDDGLSGATFSYQWVSNDGTADRDIAGAMDPSYTLSANDEGKTIKVRVSFTDRGGYAESLTSDATAVVAARPNSPATGGPAITGTAQVGETLTADTSGIADDDGLSGATFSYQWVSNDGTADRDIADATDSTYTLVAYDEGKTIRVRVSFTDDAANEESLTSDATAVVAARPNSPATGDLGINGAAQVGETLTADTSGIADDDGLSGATFSYQWVSNNGTADRDIAGATDSTYTLVAADEGKTIRVRVSFTDDSDNEETLTSAATAAIAADPRATPPTISSIAITSDTGDDDSYYDDDGVYGIGDSIEVTVTFSENVSVTGTPRLELDIGGASNSAEYERAQGSAVMFNYTVAEGDADSDGIAIEADNLTLNGGSIKDSANNVADLSHNALPAREDHRVDGIRPTISRVYLSSMGGGSGDLYTVGTEILVRVEFTESARISGRPQLTWTSTARQRRRSGLAVGWEVSLTRSRKATGMVTGWPSAPTR